MSLANRYRPSHPQGASCLYAMDFSAIVPWPVGLQTGTLEVYTNTVPPQPSGDFTAAPVGITGRRLVCRLAGGIAGTDYRLRWTASDRAGNTWPRTALLLCAGTS